MDSAVVTVFGLPAVVDDRGHSLSLRGEVETDEVLRQMLSSDLLDISLEALHHNKHSLFGSGSFLGEARCVAGDCLLEHLRMYIVSEVVSIFVDGIVNLDNLIDTDEDVGDSHLVHSEGTSLVRADVIGTTHDLA
jgi:hypothetical protein